MIYTGQHFDIEIGDDWEAQESENCHSIYKPNGVGALQISTYKKCSEVTDDELIKYVIKNPEMTDEYVSRLEKQSWGEGCGYQIVYAVKDRFWRRWYLKNGIILLFATYNCQHQHKDQELSGVNVLLSSIKIRK